MSGFGRMSKQRNPVSSSPGWKDHFRPWIEHKPTESSFPKPERGLKGQFWEKHELTFLSAVSPVPTSASHRQRGIESMKMLQWCLTLTPLGNCTMFVERIWDQCISALICLPSRWGGQQLHTGTRSLICLYARYYSDLYFISLQKVIPPDYVFCWSEDEAAPWFSCLKSLPTCLLSVGADCRR